VRGCLLARHRDAHKAVHHTARRGHAKGHPARPLRTSRLCAVGTRVVSTVCSLDQAHVCISSERRTTWRWSQRR
jgi:hypothetical protein